MAWEATFTGVMYIPISQFPPVLCRLCLAGPNLFFFWGGSNAISIIPFSGGQYTTPGPAENDGYDFIDFAYRGSSNTMLALSSSGVVYEFDLSGTYIGPYAPLTGRFVTAIETGFYYFQDEIWFADDTNQIFYMDYAGSITSSLSGTTPNPIFRIRIGGSQGSLVACSSQEIFIVSASLSQNQYVMSASFDYVNDICANESNFSSVLIDSYTIVGYQGSNGVAVRADPNYPPNVTNLPTGFYPSKPMLSVGSLYQFGTDPADSGFLIYNNDFGFYAVDRNGNPVGGSAYDNPGNFGSNFISYTQYDGVYVSYGCAEEGGTFFIVRMDSQETTPPDDPPMDPPTLVQQSLSIIVSWPAYQSDTVINYVLTKTDTGTGVQTVFTLDSGVLEHVDTDVIDEHTYTYSIFEIGQNHTSPDSDPSTITFFLTPTKTTDISWDVTKVIPTFTLPSTPLDPTIETDTSASWTVVSAPANSKPVVYLVGDHFIVQGLAYGETRLRFASDTSPFKVQDLVYRVMKQPVAAEN